LAAAISGEISDPADVFATKPKNAMPEKFFIDDACFKYPPKDGAGVEIIRGPNIKALPEFKDLEDMLKLKIVLIAGDNITTDHILPAGSKVLPYRSNLPKISEFAFERIDKDFAKRAIAAGQGMIVGGSNYGQGSSREHAAMAPRFLGIRAVLVKSFARIHLANLINFGILPLTFDDENDFGRLKLGMDIIFEDILSAIEGGKDLFAKTSDGAMIKTKYELTPRQKEILFAGGLLNRIKRT
jgi:aconitate hydratase